MVLKKFFKTTIFLLLAFSMPLNALAYSDYIIAGGNNIGIELNASGVLVVGTYTIGNKNPALEAGIVVGDIITEVEGEKVYTIEQLVDCINTSSNVKITYIRNNKEFETTLKLVKDNSNISKTGLYVKDSITGVGTLTFVDPNTNLFGALGHEIIEKSTGKILEIKDGTIYDSTVTSVTRSSKGNPGEKNARYDKDAVKGTVSENTIHGIFGEYTASVSLDTSKLYKVADIDDIELGEAYIKTVLDGQEIKEYKINITKTNSKNTIKNITFEITDEELLNKTGGVIQGMSGSPIIQGDYIIGAVTHVVVDNPTKGYGIFITNMLEEAEN